MTARRPTFVLREHPVLGIHSKIVESIVDPSGTIERVWPSKIIDQRIVEQMVRHIWDTFLSESSHLEICVPPVVVINTLRRISCLDLYGPR